MLVAVIPTSSHPSAPTWFRRSSSSPRGGCWLRSIFRYSHSSTATSPRTWKQPPALNSQFWGGKLECWAAHPRATEKKPWTPRRYHARQRGRRCRRPRRGRNQGAGSYCARIGGCHCGDIDTTPSPSQPGAAACRAQVQDCPPRPQDPQELAAPLGELRRWPEAPRVLREDGARGYRLSAGIFPTARSISRTGSR